LTARVRIERLSTVWLDVAQKFDLAVVPVRYLGGLPLESTGDGFDFPVGLGTQTILLGRPILPDELRATPPRHRREMVLDALNALGDPDHEVPHPPDLEFVRDVEDWCESTSATPMAGVLFSALARSRTPVPLDDTRTPQHVANLTDAVVAAGVLHRDGGRSVALTLPSTPEGLWMRFFAGFIFGTRGPQICAPNTVETDAAVLVIAGPGTDSRGPVAPASPANEFAERAAIAAAASPAEPAAASAGAVAPGAGAVLSAPACPSATDIRRWSIDVVECPLDPAALTGAIGAGWTIVVTDDGAGVARSLRQTLESRGAQVALLTRQREGAGTYACALDSAPDVARALADVRRDLGPVRGWIHLPRLSGVHSPDALDAAGWRRVLAYEVAALLHLAQDLTPDLRAGASSGAFAVTATWLGGAFGFSRGEAPARVRALRPARPSDGGAAGFFKALAQELPELLVKVIDLAVPHSADAADAAAGQLVGEIEHGGRRIEVGYSAGARLIPRLVPSVLADAAGERSPFDRERPIVLVGGGRGITAEIARDLAREFKPQLVILGRTALPQDVAQLAALDEEPLRQLRRSIAQRIEAAGGRATPVVVQEQFDKLAHAVEIHRNLGELAALGAHASYHACDVRDADAVERTFAAIREEHGPIQGVVFSAGTIEDKLLEDKKPESFDRVLGTKAEGLFNVARAVDNVDLDFFVAFSSIAGRFGNVGQTDYAAANELVAKFMLHLAERRPATRCVALDWTGWSGVGLAARGGAADVMSERGLAVLTPAQGVALFRDELLRGRDSGEVVIAGPLGPLDRDGLMAVEPTVTAPPPSLPHSLVPPPGPVLQRALIDEVALYKPGQALVAHRTIDLGRDRWLSDHVIGGVPLLPGVVGVELMVEAATLLFPELHFAGLEDLAFHLAVKILKGKPITLRVRARAVGTDQADRLVKVAVESDFVNDKGISLVRDRCHYSTIVRLSPHQPVLQRFDPDAHPFRPQDVTSETALYGPGTPLPHGPAFRVLRELRLLNGIGSIGVVVPLDEPRAFTLAEGQSLQSSPLTREAAFQTAGLWQALRHGTMGLPHGCRRVEHFGTPPPGSELFVTAFPQLPAGEVVEYETEVVGVDGAVYDRMHGFYTVSVDTLQG
jgi:NAD(P)-dependent dehydrogenase (short-subunit alcohol dehydrogenase family)